MDRRRSFNGKYRYNLILTHRIARKSKAETIDVICKIFNFIYLTLFTKDEDKEPNIKYGDYELMNARSNIPSLLYLGSVDEVKSSKRLK